MALSYCWGGIEQLMAKADNISSLMNGFLIQNLPKTIQDAIRVTRALHVRYLWVDALCIVQDDEEDKARAINAMGLIYKNATVTIAATAAAAVDQGFLHHRPVPRSCILPFLTATGAVGSVTIEKPVDVHADDPLQRRAWTLQEGLLSPRTLAFAERELLWHCQMARSRQVVPSHLRYASATWPLPSTVFGVAAPRVARVNARPRYHAQVWRSIVRDYSGRRLTYPADRLPAVAGVARELQRVWRDEYVAGLWRPGLVEGLAWYRDRAVAAPEQASSREYLAPSWSWASVMRAVEFATVMHPLAELVDCCVRPLVAAAPFGRVAEGEVTIKAKTIRASEVLERVEPAAFHYDCDPIGDRESHILALLGQAKPLGQANKMGSFEYVAIIVEPSHYGKQRRKGLVFYLEQSLWDQASEKIIHIE